MVENVTEATRAQLDATHAQISSWRRQLISISTHLLDGSVGEAFFGNYMRMHRDLLGDAARRYLPRLLPN